MHKGLAPYLIIALLILFAVFALVPQIGAQPDPAAEAKIAPEVKDAFVDLVDGEMTTVIVTLVDQVDKKQFKDQKGPERQKAAVKALKDKASKSQKEILKFLKKKQLRGEVEKYDSFWVLNGLTVTATQAVIQELAARSDVLKITPDDIVIVPTFAQIAPPAEANLSLIQAPSLWDLGFYGQGIVVANMDSGVDLSHPDLASRWRGGSNSWFDPHGEHPTTPTDLSGHGTWTMGVMVGGDVGGTAIGVAPQAQWIAVKIFNDQGTSSATAIHQGYQWLLDPDGNSETADAPHVVNNSWTMGYPGCDLEFELDLSSLRAAGILPVFAAGNFGPYPDTSASPANNPSALAVGEVDNLDNIVGTSSRGPSSCGEPITVFPELVAPGNAVRTADLFSTYTNASGTSLAAPHVSGALALLLSAFQDLQPSIQQSALINSTVDTGPIGPEYDYGNGRLDILASYHWLQSNPVPPTATPTATPAPPTATPSASVNLALNQPVSVSSFRNEARSGAAAVDGDLATTWRTLGWSTLPSEWIKVDLGSPQLVDKVVLIWEPYYATSYTIQVSEDDTLWQTVYSTTSENGGVDTIMLNSIVARYVLFDSTAWMNKRRNFLSEFEIYGSAGGSTAPTATPLPPTATPLPPTATPLPPTATPLPPTATPLPPTATPLPPTATPLPPTATPLPPTATPLPPTATPLPPTATSLPPTATPLPSTLPESLRFSTLSSGIVPAVTTPYDDADVYLWDSNAFSRILDGSTVGLSWYADVDGLAFDAGLFYLSFDRDAGVNVPGLGLVQDEDIVQYDPQTGQWQLFFAGAAACGLNVSNGQDVDAFDIVNGVVYFSTITGWSSNPVAGVPGPYDDADIYSYQEGAGCSRVFDASVHGLPGTADIDGLTFVDNDTFYISFNLDTGTSIPGLGTVEDESVVHYDGGVWSLYFDGTVQGLGASSSQDLDAIDVQ